MEKQILEKLQNVETEILKDVTDFCDKHALKYSLYAGTLLGAVRHKGFIPWDDDVDICMPRLDYEKFLKLWREESPTGYFLQATDGKNKTTINHTKIRKIGTLLANENDLKTNENNGIWVDVFAFDKVPNSKKKQKRILFYAKLRMVYTRNYPVKKKGFLFECLSRIMLCIPNSLKRKIRNKSENEVTKYNDLTDNFIYKTFSCIEELPINLPKYIFDEFQLADFGIYRFKIFKAYDEVLKIFYGDYMEIPDENHRVNHNPCRVEFSDEK